MINLIETPQRADITAVYEVNEDMLTITIGDDVEIFDFTGLPDGKAEEIVVETLPVNPIVSASKTDGVLDIVAIRFYNEEEKSLYEVGVKDV